MNRREQYALSLVITGVSVLPYVHFLPQWIGYPVFITVLGGVAIFALPRIDTIKTQKVAIAGFLDIIGIQVAHLVFAPPASLRAFARPAIYLFQGFLFVFIIPRIVSPRIFFQAVSTIAVLLVLIGIPVLFVGDIGPLQAWRGWFTPIPGIHWKVPMLRSVLFNPNQVAIVAAVGSITTLSNYLNTQRPISALKLALLLTGIYLTTGRAGMLTFFLGAAILLIEYESRPTIVRYAVGGLAVAGGVAFVLVYSLSDVSFSGRRILWRASLQAFAENPILGFGAGDTGVFIREFVPVPQYKGSHTHNAYLRVLVTSGVIGLGGYLALCLSAVVKSIQRVSQDDGALVLALVVGICVDQIFESYSIFGLSITSAIAAATIGFGVTTYQVNTSPTSLLPPQEMKKYREVAQRSQVMSIGRKLGIAYRQSQTRQLLAEPTTIAWQRSLVVSKSQEIYSRLLTIFQR